MFLLKQAKFTLLFILTNLCLLSAAQKDSIGLIKYSPDFKFKEGLYVNFEQVKSNAPLLKTRIVTALAYDDPEFFESLLKEKKITYFENIGTRSEMNVNSVWGFSRNGVLYIRINEGYYRITSIGSICHFVANLSTYSSGNYSGSPYYYSASPYYGYPYSPYSSPYNDTKNTEMRQYLLDFKTGNVLEYNVKSMELLLMPDPELYDEYVALNNKKKKQLKFMYIRKFNERNPLYFPED
jgi:hypothetical protein